MIRPLLSLLALIAGCVAPAAQAAVTVNCTASASSIAFGTYNPLSTVSAASTLLSYSERV